MTAWLYLGNANGNVSRLDIGPDGLDVNDTPEDPWELHAGDAWGPRTGFTSVAGIAPHSSGWMMYGDTDGFVQRVRPSGRVHSRMVGGSSNTPRPVKSMTTFGDRAAYIRQDFDFEFYHTEIEGSGPDTGAYHNDWVVPVDNPTVLAGNEGHPNLYVVADGVIRRFTHGGSLTHAVTTDPVVIDVASDWDSGRVAVLIGWTSGSEPRSRIEVFDVSGSPIWGRDLTSGWSSDPQPQVEGFQVAMSPNGWVYAIVRRHDGILALYGFGDTGDWEVAFGAGSHNSTGIPADTNSLVVDPYGFFWVAGDSTLKRYGHTGVLWYRSFVTGTRVLASCGAAPPEEPPEPLEPLPPALRGRHKAQWSMFS